MIYELRMYTTRAGRMKEVVNASATVAQSIRDGDTYGKLVGHWWSSIGKLNQYVHMWEYKDVEEMRKLRSELSNLEDWRKKFQHSCRHVGFHCRIENDQSYFHE